MVKSQVWKRIRQLLMTNERLALFLSGVFLGKGDILIGAVFSVVSLVIHFLEYEAEYKMHCWIVRENADR